MAAAASGSRTKKGKKAGARGGKAAARYAQCYVGRRTVALFQFIFKLFSLLNYFNKKIIQNCYNEEPASKNEFYERRLQQTLILYCIFCLFQALLFDYF